MRKIKLLSRKKIFQGFFDVEALELQYGDDLQAAHRNLVISKSASGILLHKTDSNTFLFTRQYRLGAVDQENPYVIEIPAGVIDKNEDPETCARREVLEETGYLTDSIEKIGSFYASPGYSTEKINLFYCTTHADLKKTEGGGLDGEHEFIEILETVPEKALELLENGTICDSKTAIALYWFFLRKRD
jgi:nudix-type nucleoside diphosphatase (YffH/AdpP family)